MSWIFLTGKYAYKVKKPVRFEFADFSELDMRAHFCQRELLLNRRFTSELYLDVVPIYATSSGLRVGNVDSPHLPILRESRIVEWAVKMHQFPATDQCDYLLDQNQLTSAHLYQFGADLADQHKALPKVEYTSLQEAAFQNLDTLKTLVLSESIHGQLDEVQESTFKSFSDCRETLERRGNAGMHRHCHGDLHLANLVMLGNTIHTFDCLEFSDQLSQTDVWADVAFLFMDLSTKHRADLAYAFIDGYLSISADYDGALLLNLFACYRAMVRAKVAGLRYQQNHDEKQLRQVSELLAWTHCQNTSSPGPILLTQGLSGSGKSYWSKQLVSELGCIRIRSDLLRKADAGLSSKDSSESDIGSGLYDKSISDNLYAEMADIAVRLAQAGERVIIDAASLFRAQRELIYNKVRSHNLTFAIVSFTAKEETLLARIQKRQDACDDPSEADDSVLRWQLASQEAFNESEPDSKVFDTETGTIGILKHLVQDQWASSA